MRFYIHFHNYESSNDDNMSEFARKEQLTKLTEKVNELREKSKKTIEDQKIQRVFHIYINYIESRRDI